MDLNKAQQAFYDFIFPYMDHRQKHGCGGCQQQTLTENFAFIFVDAIGLQGCEACEKVRPPMADVMALRAKALENFGPSSPAFAGVVAGMAAKYMGSIQSAWDAGLKMGKVLRAEMDAEDEAPPPYDTVSK